jgi:hypothetical protein
MTKSIEALEKELEALKPRGALSQAQENDIKRPKLARKQENVSKYADPEIINLEKYPLEERELEGWTSCETDEERISAALDVRRMMYYVQTGKWIEAQ